MMNWIRRNQVLLFPLIAIFAANAVVLWRVHVAWTMQMGILAVLLVLTLSGLPLAWKLRDTVDDPIVLVASAFWTGILGYTFLCFVLLHRVVYHALGWNTVAACPRLGWP